MAETYDLDTPPPRPKLPGTVVVRENADSLLDLAAIDMFLHAQSCVRTFGDFHLALSGGSTPLPLYVRLMIDPRFREFPWARTHLWIVDERRVPFDDERSNFRAINEILGDHSGIPQEQVHPIFAMADDADTAYERTLREVLGWRERGQDRLDYALLGMGADAHTASLFPNSPALIKDLEPASASDHSAGSNGAARAPTPVGARLVRINSGPAVTPPDRVTMTLTLLNASRFVSVLVTGKTKRDTIARVESAHAAAADSPLTPATISALPILGISPLAGELRWYLDFDASPTTPAGSPTRGKANA